MRKSALLVFTLVLVSISLWFVNVHSQDITHVDNDVFLDPRRPPSVFPHEEHNEAAEIYECNVCHHVYEDGKKLEFESSEDMRCADCHPLESGEGDPPALMKAFHMNCKGCHEQQNLGPIMCGQCHVKD
jgi:hypothetical protein